MKVMMGTFQTGPLSSPTRLSKTHSSLDSSFPFFPLMISSAKSFLEMTGQIVKWFELDRPGKGMRRPLEKPAALAFLDKVTPRSYVIRERYF